jgi:hypothetical protein
VRRPAVARQPQPTVPVRAGVARNNVLLLDVFVRDFLEIANQACARQVGRAPGLAVRDPGVAVPPGDGERDVGAGDGVARRGADGQGEERRVAGVFAVGEVVGQADGGGCDACGR